MHILNPQIELLDMPLIKLYANPCLYCRSMVSGWTAGKSTLVTWRSCTRSQSPLSACATCSRSEKKTGMTIAVKKFTTWRATLWLIPFRWNPLHWSCRPATHSLTHSCTVHYSNNHSCVYTHVHIYTHDMYIFTHTHIVYIHVYTCMYLESHWAYTAC